MFITRLFMAFTFFAATGSVLTGQGLPSSSPEEVGLSSERLNRLDSVMQAYISSGKVPGVVTVVARRGKVAHVRAQGLMDVEAGHPMTENAIFRMASMTKPITSVAVLMLYEEGRFLLEDPVSRFIPVFGAMQVVENPDAPVSDWILHAVDREPTIRDLLTHTAGISACAGTTPLDSMCRDVRRPRSQSLRQYVERFAAVPLVYQPGTDWVYSASTDTLGYLVEVVSGMPFEEFLEQRIFAPLGMDDTGFFVAGEEADRLATLYRVIEDSGFNESSQGWPFDPPSAPSGAGGLLSTASDYVRFAQMLLNGGELDGARILGKKTVELVTMDHLPPGVTLPEIFYNTYRLGGYGFGLGVRVRTDVAQSQILGSPGEYGWAGAFETYFLVDPEEELVAMFLMQLAPSGFYPLRRVFNNLVYQAIEN